MKTVCVYFRDSQGHHEHIGVFDYQVKEGCFEVFQRDGRGFRLHLYPLGAVSFVSVEVPGESD